MNTFFQTLAKHKTELVDDPIIRAHLDTLYDDMLEQNLCRIIEPFSNVQVSYFSLSVCLMVYFLVEFQYI